MINKSSPTGRYVHKMSRVNSVCHIGVAYGKILCDFGNPPQRSAASARNSGTGQSEKDNANCWRYAKTALQ